MDTYFRGNSQELEYCGQIRAGGNHLVVASAGGQVLAAGNQLRMREKELAPALAAYRKLPKSARQPKLPNPKDAKPAQRKVPNPPPGGLIVRGYCTYLRAGERGDVTRAKQFYYKENPDRWAAETQSDMLWLTQDEWQSLVPADAKPGNRFTVAEAIQKRFFSTIGIDYMEGSVNSLPTRTTEMTIVVEKITPNEIQLRLDGYGEMGKTFDLKMRGKPNTRGSAIRVLGYLTYSKSKKQFTRFDIVGVGEAWGMKRRDGRAIRIEDYPWFYGIACELVTGDSAIDRIPPYNLLHYGSAGPYFPKKK